MGVVDVLLHREYPKYLINRQVKDKVQLQPSKPEKRYADLVK
jgi:D-3-phosphoglycerate dehydrogenase